MTTPGRDVDAGAPALPEIEHPYLLITWIPHFVDARGTVWLDATWHRDVMHHLRYIKSLVLACPRYPKADQPDLLPVESPSDLRLRFVALPRMDSMRGALLRLPFTIAALWRAIARVKIVHSSIVGWPFPIGWAANPIALLQGRKLIIVVESAFWRLAGTGRENWKDRIRAVVTESLGRWFVNRANLAVFTQPSYRASLFTRGRGRALVAPASWVAEEDILSDAQAGEAWREKTGPPRLLFAGRLSAEKGVETLVEAVRILRTQGYRGSVDIIGSGPLRDKCVRLAADGGSVEVRVLDPVPYGPRFFELLRRYHAVLIPSLSDEQPRVLFDAYSQAVPAIATATPGLVPYLSEGGTGWLVRPNDPAALAAAIRRSGDSPAELRRMGLEAVKVARGVTQSGMHRRRWQVILECFGSS